MAEKNGRCASIGNKLAYYPRSVKIHTLYHKLTPAMNTQLGTTRHNTRWTTLSDYGVCWGPVCWQKRAERHLWVRLRWASDSSLPGPLPHVPCHCCPPQISDLYTQRERVCVCGWGVSRYKRELEKGVDKCIFYSTQCSQVPVLWLRRTSRCSKRQHTWIHSRDDHIRHTEPLYHSKSQQSLVTLV